MPTLSVKISKMLKNELDINVDDEIFWTDSKVVLGYINSDTCRFKVFGPHKDRIDRRIEIALYYQGYKR